MDDEIKVLLARLEQKLDDLLEDYSDLKSDVKELKNKKPTVSELDLRLKLLENKYEWLSKTIIGAIITAVVAAILTLF